ncbi:hypothetical protein SSPSH_003252 [Salinisphaera shabanensis E1L3A]|uniref:Uncharacterized protein n=1 Tax=Salinisphaera shabanensis E1L3A TaxID=1033802 RepID=U2EIK8_9GAMM|nr:hypothetical protein SSPSH_003252 [Salinisphaera shabanensis E1L3A]
MILPESEKLGSREANGVLPQAKPIPVHTKPIGLARALTAAFGSNS